MTRPFGHFMVSIRGLIWPAVLVCMMVGGCAREKPEPQQGGNVLACRLASYGAFEEAGWSHLPSIGVRYVFLSVPPPEEIEAVRKRLADHGLTVVDMRGDTDLSRESCVDELAVQLDTCEKMGVKYMFLSAKRHNAEKAVVCERLRKAGEIAAKHGVTIVLETHPDLGTNADVHIETMKQINHPNVRVNFDTGNIGYYNENADVVAELEKVIDYVGTVELKDHNGQFETWSFPALGKGTVDFPGVLKVLKEHGYTGPLVMEIEGVKGVERTEDEIKQDIADSAAYIRSLGILE